MKTKIELNITMRCNLGCFNCNRMCNVYKNRTEDMSVDQIKKFIEQMKQRPGQKRIKIVGGEPLLHPNISEINDILADAVEKKYITSAKYGTNKTIKLPDDFKKTPFVRFSGMLARKKHHLPYLWSPLDMGLKTGNEPKPKRACPQLRRCGYSLDKYGYLPCSLAIMIVRLFGLTHLYKHELPDKPWGLDEICKHCIMSMDQTWRKQNAKLLKAITEEEKNPSKTFKDAMEVFDVESFYKTQKEF